MFYIISYLSSINVLKWKTTKYHIVGTFPESNRTIVEGGQIDTQNTQIHDVYFPGLAQAHQIKIGGVKLEKKVVDMV